LKTTIGRGGVDCADQRQINKAFQTFLAVERFCVSLIRES